MPLSAARVLLHPPKRYCLYYDGEDDYVEVTLFDWDRLENGFTIIVMVRPLAGGDMRKDFFYGSYGDAFLLLEYREDSKVFLIGLRNQDLEYVQALSSTVDPDRWYWVASTWNKEKLKIFLNGELSGSVDDTRTTRALELDNTWLRLGYRRYGCFYGDLAFTQVYSRILSATEIQHNYLNPMSPVLNGLVLWFKMEEGLGTTVHDYSGYGNDGTIYGATWTEITHDPVRTLSPVRILSNVR